MSLLASRWQQKLEKGKILWVRRISQIARTH